MVCCLVAAELMVAQDGLPRDTLYICLSWDVDNLKQVCKSRLSGMTIDITAAAARALYLIRGRTSLGLQCMLMSVGEHSFSGCWHWCIVIGHFGCIHGDNTYTMSAAALSWMKILSNRTITERIAPSSGQFTSSLDCLAFITAKWLWSVWSRNLFEA